MIIFSWFEIFDLLWTQKKDFSLLLPREGPQSIGYLVVNHINDISNIHGDIFEAPVG